MAIMPTAPAKPPATSSVANDMAGGGHGFVFSARVRVNKKSDGFFHGKTRMENDLLICLRELETNLLNFKSPVSFLKEGTSTYLPPTCGVWLGLV